MNIIILNLIYHISFLISVYFDIKQRIIPEIIFLIMLSAMLIKSLILNTFIEIYLSISIFIFPIFLLLLVETYINKEIIGLGDIKIFITIALFFNNSNIFFVYDFYTKLFIFSGICIIITNLKEKYIAFAPYIFIIFEYFVWLKH